MERTSELFNAEDMTAALPVGILLSMEEQKAKGVPIESEMISETKAALFPRNGCGGRYSELGDDCSGYAGFNVSICFVWRVVAAFGSDSSGSFAVQFTSVYSHAYGV